MPPEAFCVYTRLAQRSLAASSSSSTWVLQVVLGEEKIGLTTQANTYTAPKGRSAHLSEHADTDGRLTDFAVAPLPHQVQEEFHTGSALLMQAKLLKTHKRVDHTFLRAPTLIGASLTSQSRHCRASCRMESRVTPGRMVPSRGGVISCRPLPSSCNIPICALRNPTP